ncbi:MAG TPA: hypothetical protein VF169_18140 [Albitalea sp.]|uniref:hypothetical protein n=1 Tax=Piscinibacter sp. TaxID=1903157 RepID=UPI002ED2F073
MTRASQRLPAWQRACLFGSGALLLVTGVAWLVVHYGFGAGAGGLPHPLEAWTMRLHGLAAFVALFVLGVLAAVHIPTGWRMSTRHRHAHQRGSGLTLCVLAGLAVATGYLLYYFAPEPVRPALGWLHAAAGLALSAMFAVHRRRAASRHFTPK